MKPVLLLQLRPNDQASEEEYQSFLNFGGLNKDKLVRWRMDKQPPVDINLGAYSAVVVGGGPSCISTKEQDKFDYQLEFEPHLFKLVRQVMDHDMPFFGVCYGLSVLARLLDGEVSTEKYSEPVGGTEITLTDQAKHDNLFTGVEDKFTAYGGHKEAVQSLPANSTLLAASDSCPIQAIRYKENIYGFQFHPELDIDSLTTRIHIYSNAGYFPPEDANKIINKVNKYSVTQPRKLWRNFIANLEQ